MPSSEEPLSSNITEVFPGTDESLQGRLASPFSATSPSSEGAQPAASPSASPLCNRRDRGLFRPDPVCSPAPDVASYLFLAVAAVPPAPGLFLSPRVCTRFCGTCTKSSLLLDSPRPPSSCRGCRCALLGPALGPAARAALVPFPAVALLCPARGLLSRPTASPCKIQLQESVSDENAEWRKSCWGYEVGSAAASTTGVLRPQGSAYGK